MRVLGIYLAFNLSITDAFNPTPLPGPDSLPLIGSTSLIEATINNKVVEELVSLRREHGPIFLAKTGPVTQVWVDDAEIANELFSMESTAGRSQLKKPVFGGDFLFLVRDVERARKIRSNQKALLAERSSSPSVLAAVDSSNLSAIISEQLDQSNNSKVGVSWPSKRIASASFDALVSLYVGCQPLTVDEVDRLLRAVAGYRRRGVPNVFEVIARTFGVSKKLSFTDEINGLLSEVVSRANVSPELLPLLVSATVGGAEIFPLLLRWSVLRLSVDKATQKRLHEELVGNPDKTSSVPPMFIQVAAACARDCPVSAATGPPRKITQPTLINGYEIPAESIAFSLHPGLRAAGGGAPWEVGLHEDTWPLEMKGATSWGMFGGGPRACPASEQSLNFLASSIATLVRDFEWEPVAGDGIERMFEIEGDGSLLVPKHDTLLKFSRR
ncbi:hypothetical protein TrST_g13300 [Triparma strigata]|uniref:Cytochrome P450 n=1 Tax=Triparma strigata TaxID=1606541 RepID=A0A9W7ENU7_9STRA|nr:hypothetical protein TrST_g13300 [Triparma strigata]